MSPSRARSRSCTICAKAGARGRDPHPIFQTQRYLDDHPEVKASGQCPLVHYVVVGWQLGYRPGDLFDPEWYVEQHPEANVAGLPCTDTSWRSASARRSAVS